MAFNKAREEKKWRIRKEAEERLMRKLGVKEEIINQLRIHDLKEFNSEQRFYRRLVKADTYINHLIDEEQEKDVYTIEELLDCVENEQLFKALCRVDKLTLEIVLDKINGYSSKDISEKCGLSVGAVKSRIYYFKKRIKKVL